MIFKADIGFVADLQALLAPIASTDSVSITATESPRSNPVFFNSEPTRVGRRWRCRNMSDLSLCLCGESAHPGDATDVSLSSIRCQRTGCETIWVSNFVDFVSSRLNRLSFIFGVLGMRTLDQDIGFVRCAPCKRRRGGGSCCNKSCRNIYNTSTMQAFSVQFNFQLCCIVSYIQCI